MLKNKHWQIQSTILEMAQATGFLKRVYKIYNFWQLEDVNLQTELNSVHFQGEHLAFRSARRYTATRKGRYSCRKLEHTAAPQPEADRPSETQRLDYL